MQPDDCDVLLRRDSAREVQMHRLDRRVFSHRTDELETLHEPAHKSDQHSPQCRISIYSRKRGKGRIYFEQH